MADAKRPTQKTRPKKGEPVKIPVPKRSEFDRLLKRVTSPGARGKGARRGPWRLGGSAKLVCLLVGRLKVVADDPLQCPFVSHLQGSLGASCWP